MTINLPKLAGFDLDHCLIKYKHGPMQSLVTNCLVEYLNSSLGWNLILEDIDLKYSHKGVVYDSNSGHHITYDAHSEILGLVHGYNNKQCSIPHQIPKSMDILTCSSREVYLNHLTYFDTMAVAIEMAMVNYIDTSKTQKTYKDVIRDMTLAFDHIFNPIAFSTNRGGYFSAIKNSPGDYICSTSSIDNMKVVRRLRDKGTRVALITNSHYDYANLLLTHVVGPNWMSWFDISIVHARKPRFFSTPAVSDEEEEIGFYKINFKTQKQGEYIGSTLPPNEGKESQVFAEGNAYSLINYARSMWPNERHANSDTVYFGDSLNTDIIPAAKFGWKVVAISEECDLVS